MKTFLFPLFLVFSLVSFGQTAPGIQWQRVLDIKYYNFSTSVQATANGGYVFTGHSNDHCGIIKLNSGGTVQWQYIDGNDTAYSIAQTADGGYIAATSLRIIKLNNAGALQWQKSIGSANTNSARSIIQTQDGGYVFCGKYNDSCWVEKLNDTGAVQWQKIFGGKSGNAAASIKQTKDGGYIIAGTTGVAGLPGFHNASGTTDYLVIKLAGNGDLQWQKCLGGYNNDIAKDISQTDDDGYIIAGTSFSNDGDVTAHHNVTAFSDEWVVKLNATGNIQWQKSLGGSYSDVANSIIEIAGGGAYIIAGNTNSNDNDVNGLHDAPGGPLGDGWLVKIDTKGKVLWQKCLGGEDRDMCASVARTKGGGYITAGSTASHYGDVTGFPPDGYSTFDKYWIIKFEDVNISIVADTTTTICKNDPVTFTATVTGDVTTTAYQWRRNNTDVGTNSPVYRDSLLHNGDSVYCILTYDTKKDTSKAIVFAVSNVTLPSIKASIAGGTTVCNGTPVTFTAVLTHAANSYTLQWKKNNAYVGVNSLTYIDSTLNNGDSVWCVLTSYTSCIANPVAPSNKIKIVVKRSDVPTLSVTTTPGTYRFCGTMQTTQLAFHASVKNGGPVPFYQWKKNGINVGTNSAYYNDSLLKNDDSVWCVFTSTLTCRTSTSVSSNKIKIAITAPIAPTVTVMALPVGSICLHTPVRFKASIKNGGSAPHYQWKKNNINVGADSDTYTDSVLFNNDSVWCVFTSNAECVVNNPAISAKIKQAVYNNPPLKPSAIAGPTSLKANQLYNGYSVNRVNDVSYTWTVPTGCTIVNGQGTNQIVVNWGTTTGSVIVRAKNVCGQSDSSKLLVHVVSSFSSGATDNNTGSEDELKTAGKEGIQLYPNPAVNTAYISFTSPDAGKYFIQVTDAQGRVLQTKETNAVKGDNKVTVDVSHYAQGMYFIRLAGSNKQQSLRLLIQR